MNWRMQLRTAIEDRFDDSEIQTLCFDLGVKYESLSGDNLNDKVRELIEYFVRQGEIPRLISYCKEAKRNVPWEEIEAAAREADEAEAKREAENAARLAAAAVAREEAEAATTSIAAVAAPEVKAGQSPVSPAIKPSQPTLLALSPQTIGIAVIGILVVIGAIYLVIRSLRPEAAGPAVADVPTAQTRTETVATAVPATATDEPTQVATEVPPTPTKAPPTPTDEPTAPPTLEPTSAPTVEATVQAEPTAELSVDAAADAEPTVLYPDGTPLELTYDATSFYLYNPSSDRVPVSNFSFETLDDAGRPLIFGLSGDRWTQFYNFVDALACNGIEPFGVGGIYLRPQYCRSYNATITPEANGVELFWIERPGAVEFRVSWNGEEIARCPLGTNTCIVRVPAP